MHYLKKKATERKYEDELSALISGVLYEKYNTEC